MSNDAMDFLMSTGAPTIKFPRHGAKCEGEVLSMEKTQQTDIDGKPRTFDDGNPMWQIVITLQTTDRDATIEADTGARRLFAKGYMLQAIRAALREAKFQGSDMVRGVLEVTYTGDGEVKRRGYSAPKLYSARFWPPPADDNEPDEGVSRMDPGPPIEDYDLDGGVAS